jgi:hypothetical protein
MKKDTHLSNQKGQDFLRAAFGKEQEFLLATLGSSNSIIHDGDRGEVNEQHFIDLLRHYLPNRYTIEKASIVDSEGNASQSIDVVIFDRQYTPTLLDNDKHRYVPAEAVYAVFECKPMIDKGYLEYAGDKARSVRQLKRTSVPIAHAGGTYAAKPHFDIVAGILAVNVTWADGFGEAFRETHQRLTGDLRVDCGLAVAGESFDVFGGGFAYTLTKGKNALVFFLFRLLNKLQSLGTVPAIDWNAYASQLSGLVQHKD